MFKFFKKKIKNKEGLIKAKELGLITEKEMLQLELERTKEKLAILEKLDKKR